MTKEDAKKLEENLVEKGFTLYKSCLSSTEDYGYFKSGDVTYDEDGDKHVGYQLEFRFWDWTKYGEHGVNEFGVDIIVITSASHRVDMVFSLADYSIDDVEKIGEDFYSFVKEHKMLEDVNED